VPSVVVPPPDLKLVIDKVADQIARLGTVIVLAIIWVIVLGDLLGDRFG
jgi:hypothetical protein